jgi:hypothetical protein
MVIICHASFNMVTNEQSRSLFLCSSSATDKILPYLPTSNSTLRNWIEKEFEEGKNKIKSMLRKVEDRSIYPSTFGPPLTAMHLLESSHTSLKCTICGIMGKWGEGGGDVAGQGRGDECSRWMVWQHTTGGIRARSRDGSADVAGQGRP